MTFWCLKYSKKNQFKNIFKNSGCRLTGRVSKYVPATAERIASFQILCSSSCTFNLISSLDSGPIENKRAVFCKIGRLSKMFVFNRWLSGNSITMNSLPKSSEILVESTFETMNMSTFGRSYCDKFLLQYFLRVLWVWFQDCWLKDSGFSRASFKASISAWVLKKLIF